MTNKTQLLTYQQELARFQKLYEKAIKEIIRLNNKISKLNFIYSKERQNKRQ